MRSARRARIVHHSAGGGGSSDPLISMPGLWGLYYSDAGTSTTTDGVGVQTWSDQSGNGHHLTQATAGFRPLYKAAIVNGLPALRWDGVDDVLSIAGISNAPGTDSPYLSLFAVVKNAGTDGGLVSTRDNGSNGWVWRCGSAARVDYFTLGGGSANDFVTTTDWNILEVVRDDLSLVMGHNGTMASAATLTGEPVATTRLDVGEEAPGGAPPDATQLTGDMAALAIFTAATSDPNRDALESSWGSKYGITVA